MKFPSSLLRLILAIPAAAIVIGLSLFFLLSVQHTDRNGDWLEHTNRPYAQESDRNHAIQSGSDPVSNTSSRFINSNQILDQADIGFDSPGGDEPLSTEFNLSGLAVAGEEAEAIIVTRAEDVERTQNPLVSETAGLPTSEDSTKSRGDRDSRGDNEAAENDEPEDEPVEDTGAETLAGRVINKRGLPVADIAITATHSEDGRKFKSTVQSDSDGHFELNNIASGEYLLKTAATSLYASVSQHARAGTSSVTLIVEQQYRIDVTGQITTDNGQPIEAVDVFAVGGESNTTTDPDGAYRIAIESTDSQGFLLQLTAVGYEEKLVRIEVPPDAAPVVANHVMRRSGNLSIIGQVLDPQFNPVENALVQVASQQRDYYQTVLSDESGHFNLSEVPPATDYSIEASASPEYGVWSRDNVAVTASINMPIELSAIDRGRIVGSIVDLYQRPLGNFSLLASRSGANGRVTDIKSDSGGFFEIDELVTEDLSLVSRSSPRIQIDGVRVDKDSEAQLKLVVNIGKHEVTGFVYDEVSEDPVVFAQVRISWQETFGTLVSRVTDATSTDQRGYFRFSGLGGGVWTITVKAKGYYPGSMLAGPEIDYEMWLGLKKK